MPEWIRLIFDTTGFTPGWDRPFGSSFYVWLHIIAALTIWAAFTAVPLGIAVYLVRRPDTPFPRSLWLFAAFLLLCGSTHLMNAVVYWWPAFRLSALLRLLAAAASLATMAVLFARLPQLLRFPSLASLNAQLLHASEARAVLERKLVERSKLLQAALAAGQAGAWSYDFSSRRLNRYPSLSKLFGLPETHATETLNDWIARIDPEEREAAAELIARDFHAAKAFTARYRIVQPDGERRWVTVRGDVVADAAGTVTGLAGIVADVTADRAAAIECARLAAIVRSAPDAIIALNPNGVVTEWNRGAQALYGYAEEEIVGSHVDRLVPKLRRDEFRHHLTAALEKCIVGPLETVRRGRDGRMLPIELVAAPIVDADDVAIGVLTIERDISQRQDSERELRAMNRALAQRSEEMEQFLTTVSHDLKSPLVTIRGFAGVVADEIGPTAPLAVRDPLQRIERAAERMAGLIDHLLEVSRIGRTPNRPALFESKALARELQADLSDELARAQITLEIEDAMPTVFADPTRLRQMLENLVSNAAKYGCPKLPAKIVVGGEETDAEVCLYVRDFGPGVPEQFREKVFQLFQRLGHAGPGAGVGLAIVRRMMQAHNGRAWIEATPTGGTTVWLAFPKEPLEPDDVLDGQ
ncbi:MAG: PAS domain S-box protein [Phycisphaerae bacterium]|nr:PAS domain S-box protein [Phycisphaerae bacterium]